MKSRAIRIVLLIVVLLIANHTGAGLGALASGLPSQPSAPDGMQILVNTTTDELNADGDCSLREAIRASNLDQAVDACTAGNGADTIVLQNGVTYTLTRVGADDTAINGDLDITSAVTIVGSNAIIDANGATTLDRVIQVFGGQLVKISNVTLRNGRTTSFGGGIRNAGNLTLITVTLSSNQSTTNAGGGIANEANSLTLIGTTISNNTAFTLGGGIALLAGTLVAINLSLNNNTATNDRGGGMWVGTTATATLIHSTVSSNDAGTNGGGIYNENNLTLVGSTVHTNQAGVPGGGTSEAGGGIYNQDSLTIKHSTIRNNAADDGAGLSNNGGSLTIFNSTINNNAAISAGGIRNQSAGVATLVNSTVSSNTASAGAGGIANSATLQLSNVTIAFNTADSDANNFGDGGGLANGGTATVRNSLIGENIDASTSGTIFPDCSGGFTSDGYNLIENTTGCTIGGNTTGNVTGIDPNLAALTSNGGRTQTNAFPTGSPPHNAGNPAGCLDNNSSAILADQRDGARLTRCDQGSFEFAACLLIGDVDDDGDVDNNDLALVGGAWTDRLAYDAVLDLVVDGFIFANDLQAVASRFGLVCS